jgi:DNA-binding transcriptional regulator YiaG
MCDQRLALSDDLPDTAQELRSVKGVTLEPLTKQAAVLLEHGKPHESLKDLLLRMEQNMSKNQTSEHLGISKATLYEWRKQEQIE